MKTAEQWLPEVRDWVAHVAANPELIDWPLIATIVFAAAGVVFAVEFIAGATVGLIFLGAFLLDLWFLDRRRP